MNADVLPNDVLEQVLSMLSTHQDLTSCRLTSRRWNRLAVGYWRKLESTRAVVSNEESIFEFLNDMDTRIQDFPFCRVRFKSINLSNLEASKSLLRYCSAFLEDLEVYWIAAGILGDGGVILSLLQMLDVSSMPNLKHISLIQSDGGDGMIIFSMPKSSPILNLQKLRTLRLRLIEISLEPFNGLLNYLVQSAPNLRLVQTDLKFIRNSDRNIGNRVSFVWPFDENCRRIQLIKLRVTANVFNDTLLLLDLMGKLEEWTNVRVTELSLNVIVTARQNILLTKQLTERLINEFANDVKCITVVSWPSTFYHHIQLPVLAQLETLELSFFNNRDTIEAVVGNPFPCLQKVILSEYREPCQVFRSAVLPSVKTVSLSDARSSGFKPVEFTLWDTVFPNLESFDYAKSSITGGFLDVGHLQFLVTRLHKIHSLKHLSLRAGSMNLRRSTVIRHCHCHFHCQVRGVKEILSGFDNFERVIAGAKVAKQRGGIQGEEAYWTEKDSERQPCLVNMSGLKSFLLHEHFPDDDFASGIIVRMQPLDRIEFYGSRLSQEMANRVTARHKDVRIISSPVDLTSLTLGEVEVSKEVSCTEESSVTVQ